MTPPDGTQSSESAIVLVIERDVLIRASVSAYLRHCGFKVIEASDADEAFAVLRTELKVAVVFSDIGIAGDGFGLAQWVRRERPNVKIVLSSGLKRSTEEAGKLCQEGPHLKEPYDPAMLEREIRELLAGRSRG